MASLYEVEACIDIDADEVDSAVEELADINDVCVTDGEWARINFFTQVAAQSSYEAYRRGVNGVEARLAEGDIIVRAVHFRDTAHIGD